MIRLPATSSQQRIGSLVFNPGGPGGSGVGFVQEIASTLPPGLRARFDIVGFDPRGTNGSSPLRCFESLDQMVKALPDFPFPTTRSEEKKATSADRKLGKACARRGGPILNHMSTADTARDMDRLRQALGDRKLTYVGYSYGSVLGQTYANLFPQHIRALVIDGVVDPVAWTTGHGQEAATVPLGTRLGSDVGARDTLGEFFRLCDAAGPGCALSGGAERRYTAIAQRLRRHPLSFKDSTTGESFDFTYAWLITITLAGLYDPSFWIQGASLLADLESSAPAAKVMRAVAAVRTAAGLDGPVPTDYPNIIEASPGVACSDSDNPRSPAAWSAAASAAARLHGDFGRRWTWMVSACRSWPASAGQDRYQGPWNAVTSAPVLVVGNYFDPATPYPGAVVAARLLPRSRLLTYAGWGHTAFLRGNRCIDGAVIRYLLRVQLPPAGTVCQPEGSPFAPPAHTAG